MEWNDIWMLLGNDNDGHTSGKLNSNLVFIC